MPVQNRIVKIQKRNRALVTFDPSRICGAILRAAESIGGFQQDFLPGINEAIFAACDSDEKAAAFIGDMVIVCLNADAQHPADYGGFLDARVRFQRALELLESVEGLTREQIVAHDLIPADAVIREFVGGSTIKIPHNE